MTDVEHSQAWYKLQPDKVRQDILLQVPVAYGNEVSPE